VTRARLVGVIHLPPLPGILAKAGYDLVIVENFGDAPFFAGRVPSVVVSAMTACALAVREASPDLALGINVLRNDADAALAVAVAAGAACIRVNVHTGARVTDQGLVEGRAAETLRTRRALGADGVALWADVDVKHSAPLAPRDIGREAEDLVLRGLADAVLVTGEGTGRGVDLARLRTVREAVPDAEVLVASGVRVDSVAALAGLCDGVIVGSALRAGGVAGGPVDPERAQAFAAAFRRAFQALPPRP
jgi:membrane complex biogenesis BtpA family protein